MKVDWKSLHTEVLAASEARKLDAASPPGSKPSTYPMKATVNSSHITHGHGSFLLGNIMGTMLNYQRDPMSTLEGPLVTLILKVAHLITSAAVEVYATFGACR